MWFNKNVLWREQKLTRCRKLTQEFWRIPGRQGDGAELAQTTAGVAGTTQHFHVILKAEGMILVEERA